MLDEEYSIQIEEGDFKEINTLQELLDKVNSSQSYWPY
jgi:acyl carrier protein